MRKENKLWEEKRYWRLFIHWPTWNRNNAQREETGLYKWTTNM